MCVVYKYIMYYSRYVWYFFKTVFKIKIKVGNLIAHSKSVNKYDICM